MNSSSFSRCGAIAGGGAPCVRHNITFFKPTTTTTTSTNLSSSSSSSSCCIRFNTNVFITQSSLQYQSTQHKRSCNSDYPKPSFNHQDPSAAAAAAAADPELRTVLQLATNSELFELHSILFRPSYFSPLLKSVVTNELQIDRFMIEEDFEERDQFIDALESRFLYLAADARSTLRGWRPSYRNVLLDVRKQLKIPCSTRLSVEDLEVEIFIFMIQECSRDWDADALRVGAAELCSLLLKGGQLVSLMKISQLVSKELSGKMLIEAAKHKFGNEVIKKGLTGATSRYLGMSSLATLFGPMLWGTFLADVVIQMLGTDYSRILQAIYAFAQIRILRRHGLHLDKLGTGF